MAQFHLFSVLVHTPPVSSDFVQNDVIDTYWDDSTSAIVVKKNGVVFAGSSAAYFGEQGTNYHLSRATSYEGEYAVSGYSYCSGADLKWFRMLLSYPFYPYAEQQTTVDSPVCDTGGGAVCDIHFTGAPVITHATDRTTGGSFTVTAVSSNGTVRYGLRNDPYASMTNTTGAFTGRAPGSWTVYAKDANDCTAIITVKILFKPTEAEHYRFTWATTQVGGGTSYDARVRIYEREYIGSVVEVDYGDDSPFKLNKPKQGDVNDKFFPVHPTNATLSLIAEHDYQFLPLFTQDNKKYRVVYEVDEGSGFVEVWQGFIVPSVYLESLIAAPYAVEIQIADNVKTLETEPFTDNDGNLMNGSVKVIAVIAHIMKKTGLSLKIRSGINIFETNHNTAATDDPLDQTYVDVSCYREDAEPFDCWRVLESILRPFGARIYQYDNQWIIEEIDRAVASYAYRVFTSDGVYESNSTFDPVIDVKSPSLTSRAAFIDRDQTLQVIPAYGQIDITSKLNYIGSIVAGGFEKSDLLSPNSEQQVFETKIFESEEGFKDWTLRMPSGVEGVSFGRAIILEQTAAIPQIIQRGSVVSATEEARLIRRINDADGTRSVGAIYYLPDQWKGNLRNSYIESAAKNYEYGPNDELRFTFHHSAPINNDYPFMTVRFMLKLGNKYLQEDLTWDTTEHIFRAYPKISDTMQKFEISVPTPETTEVVSTTIQVRIYFYAPEFYDFGLPPTDGEDPSTGTDGLSDLRDFPTVGIDYDYNLEFRLHTGVGSVTNYTRNFAELAYSDAAEDLGAGIIHPDDHNGTTNPKIWRKVGKTILENNSTNNRTRGIARAFYIDDVAVDTLPGGQPPPEEDTISLTISKYINENLALELYNFDLPDIVNGKNMYNNYFRLSDGTPTSAWARSGISESLTLQEILLKVLGGNHAAPTFRVTGSFINEFERIGINNYIRITKPGSSLSANNTEFSTDLTGWSQSSIPLLSGTWSWVADNSGSAEVTLSSSDDSKKIYQDITHDGGYIEFTVNVKAVPNAGSTREDVLWVLLYREGSIIHAEKMQTFAGITSESDYNFTYTAFAPGQVDRIGFYIKAVGGSGTCKYQMSKFAPVGKDITEVYQIADYQSDERARTYFFELMQISKTYVSLSSIDTGGNNQGGSTTGREHSSAYSTAYS